MGITDAMHASVFSKLSGRQFDLTGLDEQGRVGFIILGSLIFVRSLFVIRSTDVDVYIRGREVLLGGRCVLELEQANIMDPDQEKTRMH